MNRSIEKIKLPDGQEIEHERRDLPTPEPEECILLRSINSKMDTLINKETETHRLLRVLTKLHKENLRTRSKK